MGHDDSGYELAGLGDLVELLVDGWRIATLHYADRSGAAGLPAAYFGLTRAPGEARGVYVPDDGRALSHRAVVELFRESPRIWKHREAAGVPAPEAAAEAPEEWGEVPEPFPQALALDPSTLREVVPVGQVQSVGGLDIALLCLERHAAAARLRYMCHASDARTRSEMAVLDVLAVDDAGRRYRVAAVDSRAEGNRLEGCLLMAPAIPEATRRVTITVGTVWEDGAGTRRASGPWVFPIRLVPGA